IRHPNRILVRCAGELRIAPAALLTQDAAVAAKILPAGKAIAARPTIQALVKHDTLAHAVGRNTRAACDDFAGNLVAKNPAGLTAWNLPGTREYVVIADAGSMNAHQDVVGARLGPHHFRDPKLLRSSKLCKCHSLHQGHETLSTRRSEPITR